MIKAADQSRVAHTVESWVRMHILNQGPTSAVLDPEARIFTTGLLASPCRPMYVRPHVTIQDQLNGFLLNLTFEVLLDSVNIFQFEQRH